MDIHQLRIFHAVLAARNMTRAAEKLSLTPAAVSLQIRNLSKELGVELFSKAGKRLVPTSAAMRLDETTEHLLDVLAHIRQEFAPEAERDEAPLVVLTGITPLVYRLGDPVRHFRQRYPRANLMLRVSSTPHTATALRERQADVGIVVLPFEAGGIQCTSLYAEALKVCVGPRSIALRGSGIALPDLLSLPLILYTRGASATRAIVDNFFSSLKAKPKVVMELDDTEAIKKLVELGFGVSILPEHALARLPSKLRAVEIQGHRLCRHVAVATSRTEYPRKLVQAFCRVLLNDLGESPA